MPEKNKSCGLWSEHDMGFSEKAEKTKKLDFIFMKN
jgi:hypothetical protein